MNLTDLNARVLAYTENYEATFTSQLPTFIRLAEQRIYDAGYLPAARESQTSTLTISSPYLALPISHLSTFALGVVAPVTGNVRYLVEKDVSYIREAYPTPADTAMPKYFGHFDEDTLIVGPTPDLAYAVQLDYFAYPASITTAGTTWLGDKAENALFYGTLREAYSVFMKGEPDMVANIEKMYSEAIMLLQNRGIFAKGVDAFRKPQPAAVIGNAR